jgi:hypothetical protein
VLLAFVVCVLVAIFAPNGTVHPPDPEPSRLRMVRRPRPYDWEIDGL